MVYAPAVGRLECGEFPSDPRGFWQENGYGILSVFKEDWDRFGGGYLIFKWLPIKRPPFIQRPVIKVPKLLPVKCC